MSGRDLMKITIKTYQCLNRRLAFLVLLAVAGLLLTSLSGCAGPRKVYSTVDELNAQGEFILARNYVEEHAKDYGKRNRLLYLLDRGMFAFSTGEFREAITSFTEAEELMSELYTISLRSISFSPSHMQICLRSMKLWWRLAKLIANSRQ